MLPFSSVAPNRDLLTEFTVWFYFLALVNFIWLHRNIPWKLGALDPWLYKFLHPSAGIYSIIFYRQTRIMILNAFPDHLLMLDTWRLYLP